LVRIHTDKSFLGSLSVSVIGFILIITSLAIGFFDNPNIKDISYIAAGSGIITEFIAAVFFYLYNRTVRQMKGYHDSLLLVQNVLLSFKLVGEIQDPQQKAIMVGQMLGYLLAKGGGSTVANNMLAGTGLQSAEDQGKTAQE
jgi:hypothetical protein